MKKIYTILFFFIFLHSSLLSQNYTSYFTGNSNDTVTTPLGGICLMGGATENDNAMRWFLERASGGDVLVLRASGADGYNKYFYEELGVKVNSVETIVFNNRNASFDEYIHKKIKQAEAIWFAGGDQYKYITYWKQTPIDTLINEAILKRNIAIGGTSAGMAILGEYVFSAQNGTVLSDVALANPFHSNITIEKGFLRLNYLKNTITDTHYDNPDRKGRHITFLARILNDYSISAKGIACEEYTAVCISPDGIARVYGDYPKYDDNAFFLQIDCEIKNNYPEILQPNIPLTWNQNSRAIKVYHIKGTQTGQYFFDLNNWEIGSGGLWEDWWCENGALFTKEGDPINCNTSSYIEIGRNILSFSSNNEISIVLTNDFDFYNLNFEIYNLLGEKVNFPKNYNFDENRRILKISLQNLKSGVYIVRVYNLKRQFIYKIIVE